jgi:hypothetical protein
MYEGQSETVASKCPTPPTITIPSLILDCIDNPCDFSVSLNDFVGILCVVVKKGQGQPQYVSLCRLAFSLVYILTDFAQDQAVLLLTVLSSIDSAVSKHF